MPIGGATTIGRFLELFGTRGFDVRLASLCDAGEGGESVLVGLAARG